MSDPITNATATAGAQYAGPFLFKLLAYIIGPVAATVVVMFMTQPKSPKEWFSAVISTIMCSFGFGAYVVTNYLGISDISNETAAMIVGPVYFMSGLPGWFLVRAIFFTGEKMKNKTIFDIWGEIRGKK